ncbi:MAG: TIGR01459 family HAD-type hydrolase [Opitutaceae bacterium]|nr:TIGR01459 family HAD-type hydrolase [Opitutaceae bacterium]
MGVEQRSTLPGIGTIADSYDGFVFDVWGTVYDGYSIFPGVIDVFKKLRRLKKRVAFLSNSPQLPRVVASRLEKIGFEAQHYDGIVTSGGETHRQLTVPAAPGMEAFQGPVFQTGPDRFPDTLPSNVALIANNIEDADWILNTGPNLPPETIEDYEFVLGNAAKRDLPMLCANPDKAVFQGSERHICAGAIADRYTALGGSVRYIGKPHPAVFERCQLMLEIGTASKLLMVGDNLETDILGANRVGYHSLLIASGVHALVDCDGSISLSQLDGIEIAAGAQPNYVIDKLCW